MATKWVTRWKYELSDKPVRPGIYRLKSGGFLVRAKVTNPKTGERKDLTRVLRDAKLPEAQREYDEMIALERDRVRGKTRRLQLWSEFAAQLFEEKILRGKLASAATREWWEGTLRMYLIPELGDLYVHELARADIEALITKWSTWMRDGKPSMRKTKSGAAIEKVVPLAPRTANGWLRILRTICNEMTDRFGLAVNPFRGVEFFPEGRAHTREEPNRVRSDGVSAFLAMAKQMYPQHYAMLVLGFLLGIRPSHMRPLRRRGPEADVDWKEGLLIIRRSNSRTGEVMDRTKTGQDQEVALPPGMMRILEEHVAALPDGPEKHTAKKSDYLFPTATGGMRARTVLAKPFAAITEALGIGHKVTPRAMRRTFNNAARGAGVHDVVTRSISGHQTEEMQRHYSMAERDEQRTELGRLLETMVPNDGDK